MVMKMEALRATQRGCDEILNGIKESEGATSTL